VDYKGIPGDTTVPNDDGTPCASHTVTRVCPSVTWQYWHEVFGVSNGSYYTTYSCGGGNRRYKEAQAGPADTPPTPAGEDFSADSGKKDLKQHIYDLRDSINEERARRSAAGTALAQYNWITDDLTNVEIDNDIILELKTAIDQIQGGLLGDVNPTAGTLVQPYDIDKIRYRIENLKKSCISNNVCAPNSYCSCFCNCNCHYSDRRLKKNIRSL
jgi:hypothetical protein